MTSGTTKWLIGVGGSSGSDVFAVGADGTILHYDGSSWTPMTSGTTEHLNTVWVNSGSDVFVVGDKGTILHYDGSSWTSMTSGTTENLWDVWGTSGSNVFATGFNGTILHYDGVSGTTTSTGPPSSTTTTPSGNTPPVASFTVSPSAGDTPTLFMVDASGSSDAEDGIGALFVLWDWESDGVWDTPLDAEKMAEHQYAATGTYTITLKVEDTDGLSDTTTQEVKVISGDESNTPPTASFTVNPTEGDTATAFTLDASGSTDDGTLLEFHWDWESDGMWDTDFTIDKIASHTYTTSGLKNITLEVIDEGGLADTTNLDVMVTGGNDTTTTTVSPDDNTPPIADFFVHPPEGDTNTEFEFNATESHDMEDIPEDIEVRWDFEGDGVWEIEYDIEKVVFFKFDTPGVYPVTIEVKDTGGFADIATREVMVSEVKNCPASAVLGESDPGIDVLRQFRDKVLIKSPEGREIIRLYYEWGTTIVKVMEEDAKFKEEVKELIEGILPMIR